MKRLDYIDKLRGFAILLVVLGHVISRCYGDEYLRSSLLRFILSFWMPLFVFLSGYVSYKISYEPFGMFLRKKCVSLLLPFLSVGLLYVIWKGGEPSDFFYSSLKWGYWFTFVLFQLSLIFFLFNWFSQKVYKGKHYLLDIGIVVLPYVILIMAYYLLPMSVILLLSLKEVIRLYIFFAIGNILRKYSYLYNLILSNDWIYTLCILFFIVSIRFLHYGEDVSIQDLFIRTITAFTAVLVLFRFFITLEKDTVITKWLIILGKYSLNIYLLHYFFLPEKVPFFSIEIGSFIYDFLYAVIFVIPIIACCLLISKIIGQSKFLSLVLLGKRK